MYNFDLNPAYLSHLDVLESIRKYIGGKFGSVIEFGAGLYSTKYFKDNSYRFHSLENNDICYNSLSENIDINRNLFLIKKTQEFDFLKNKGLLNEDFYFIDSDWNSRIYLIKTLLNLRSKNIIIHDSECELFKIELDVPDCYNIYFFRSNYSACTMLLSLDDYSGIEFHLKNYNHVKKIKSWSDFTGREIFPIQKTFFPVEKMNFFTFSDQYLKNKNIVIESCLENLKKKGFKIFGMEEVLDTFPESHFWKEKLDKEIINIESFTDIFRFFYLKEFGGIWCDHDIFILGTINHFNFLLEKLGFINFSSGPIHDINMMASTVSSYFSKRVYEEQIKLLNSLGNSKYTEDRFFSFGKDTLDYLANPVEYTNIKYVKDDIEGLDFILNDNFSRNDWLAIHFVWSKRRVVKDKDDKENFVKSIEKLNNLVRE